MSEPTYYREKCHYSAGPLASGSIWAVEVDGTVEPWLEVYGARPHRADEDRVGTLDLDELEEVSANVVPDEITEEYTEVSR